MSSLDPGRSPAALCARSALLACALLAGCAAVPSQEMSDARRALTAAREANAGALAPMAMARADAALEEASAALRAGQYERARGRAGSARDAAILAREFATRIDAVEAGIAAAREAGRPWQGARDLLQHARAVSRDGDTPRALVIAERAEALLR